MENDEIGGELSGVTVKPSANDDYDPALNSTLLNYYKKFGRKRDLEQYFSLSTAQSEIRDPSSLFWRRMKAMSDSSDSGGKRSESPTELCRISIKCSAPDSGPASSQDTDRKRKSDSDSPPIITENVQPGGQELKNSDNESIKSDDNLSHKSLDATLDTSMNKLLSPSSSITSQRKLEWDSLADVGYANEGDRKNSASSLSTLERLALKQQYSNNDTQNENLGAPTAHSTPLDENDSKPKGKIVSKTTKICKKDTDFVQVNVPHWSDLRNPAINVNLTKHISFNMDREHGISVSDNLKDISVQPNPIPTTADAATTQVRMDKEIQTTLLKQKEKSSSSAETAKSIVPVLINLNALRRRHWRKKAYQKKTKPKLKRKEANKENVPVQEKSGEPVSEAESFEYMPGHIYKQKQMNKGELKSGTMSGNKSSLESSGNFTTDSSKASKHSFTKDMQKSLNLLKATCNKRYDNSDLKRKLIQEVIKRLLKANYRDDESTTDFLSGLSFGSVKLGVSEATTTSTSEANTAEKKPKKSILRPEKFDSRLIASTSQSAPNLPSVSNSEKPVASTLMNPLVSSNTESDVSSREKISSDTAFAKTSSEELYQKYLSALRREQNYKKHLKDKEMFLKQKLVCSDTAIKMPVQLDTKSQIKLKDLMKDLTRNNYDDGSGDASKLEGSNSNLALRNDVVRKQRSHSVFTLSSGEAKCSNRKPNSRKTVNQENPKAGSSLDDHYCCCPYHTKKGDVGVADSSVQVDINHQSIDRDSKQLQRGCESIKASPQTLTHYMSDGATGDIKYVCLCPENADNDDKSSKMLVYKCSRLPSKSMSIPVQVEKAFKAANPQIFFDDDDSQPSSSKESEGKKAGRFIEDSKKNSKSSQTNLAKIFNERSKPKATPCCSSKDDRVMNNTDVYIHEATRQLQTEISINPRISDPSLCDIKIIGITECAKLISEQVRQVSKSSLEKKSSETENIYQEQNIMQVNSEVSDETSISSEIKENRRLLRKMTYTKQMVEDKESVSDQVAGPIEPTEIQDNLIIPIQGTNMTLTVKIGQNSYNSAGEIFERQNIQGLVDKGFGDCSHPYQTLFSKEKIDLPRTETSSDVSKNLEKGCGVQNDLLDDFFATETQNVEVDRPALKENQQGTYNTYPKVQPKPFLRSNIDTKSLRLCKCGCKCESECVGDCGPEEQELLRNTENLDDGGFFQPIQTFSPQNVSPKSKCPCPSPAACENVCDETADCFKDAPKTCITESMYTKSPEPARRCPTLMHLPKPKCPCPSDDAACGQICDRTAECFRDFKPAITCGPRVAVHTDEPTQVKSPRVPCQKSTKCPCPDEAACGRSCDENAECYAPTDQPTQVKSPRVPCRKSTKCPCPDEAECGRSCDENAECYKPVTRSGIIPIKSSPRPSPREPRQCPCSETAECGKTCDETAECYLQEQNAHSKIEEIKLAAIDYGTDSFDTDPSMKPKPEKDGCMQTDPVEIQSVEIQKQSGTISTQGSTGTQSSKKSSDRGKIPELETPKDVIIELISDITKRYTKKDIQKSQRKKCFNEIMKILNYLLETEDPDQEVLKAIENATSGATDSEQDIRNRISCQRKKQSKDTPYKDTPIINRVEESSPASCSKPVSDPPRQVINDQKPEKTFVDKGVQQCSKKSKTIKGCCTDSSDQPISSECVCTSSDSPTCKVLEKIRKECEKYHHKRCKSSHNTKKCETSSSTSVSCDKCKRTHHCHCRSQKCKHRPKLLVDRVKRKCVAYNLIIQTSESMVSEEASINQCRPLKNIIVKVPPKRKLENMPFKEAEARIERHLVSPRCLGSYQRSRSLPNESGLSSADEAARRSNVYTVKEYLERNRPEFVQQSSKRTNCLKMISENRNQDPCAPPRLKMVVVRHPNGNDNCGGCTQPVTMYCEGVPMPTKCTCTDPYNMHMVRKEVTRIAKDRELQRELLSMHLQLQQDGQPPLSATSETDLRQLARDLGAEMRRKQEAPKFISEREMKKHSEKIYKSLPEVVQKKEELKKESRKKTNLLMANIFNKNLQKKTLRGTVNLSNYSNVFKI